MTLAKPLAGGLPIGSVLVTEKVASKISAGDHGSTFAGGPLVCHAALAVLDHIQVNIFEHMLVALYVPVLDVSVTWEIGF